MQKNKIKSKDYKNIVKFEQNWFYLTANGPYLKTNKQKQMNKQ